MSARSNGIGQPNRKPLIEVRIDVEGVGRTIRALRHLRHVLEQHKAVNDYQAMVDRRLKSDRWRPHPHE